MSLVYSNTAVTVSNSEYSIPGKAYGKTSQTTDGVYQLFVGLSNLTATNGYAIRLYEKTDSSRNQGLVEEWIFYGAQSKPVFATGAYHLGEGWDFTAIRLDGPNRSLGFSLRRVS